jgi:hypothetical protein
VTGAAPKRAEGRSGAHEFGRGWDAVIPGALPSWGDGEKSLRQSSWGVQPNALELPVKHLLLIRDLQGSLADCGDLDVLKHSTGLARGLAAQKRKTGAKRLRLNCVRMSS